MANETVQIAMFSGVVVGGLLWGRGTLRRWDEYSFSEDFKATFLRVRWKYSADLLDGGPRLIAPAMLVLMGLALLVSLLVRHLSA